MADGGRDDSAARSSRGTIPPAPPLPMGSSAVSAPMIPAAPTVPANGPSSRRLPVEPPTSTAASHPPPSIANASPPLVELLETLALGRDSAVVVTASDDAMRAAATTHVSRLLRQRASAISSVLSQATSQSGSEPVSPDAMVRNLAARRLDDGEIVDALAQALGVELESRRVGQVAEKIADRLRRGRVSVVLRIDEPSSGAGSWVALVLREIVAAVVPPEGASAVTPSLARLVLVGPPSCPTLASLGVATVSLTPDLDPREIWSWIDAVARGAGRAVSTAQTTLPQLEGALARVAAVPELSAQ